MRVVEGLISAGAILSVGFFLLYVIGIFRLPTGSRPDTPTLDRHGEPLPAAPNPGYQETEGEEP